MLVSKFKTFWGVHFSFDPVNCLPETVADFFILELYILYGSDLLRISVMYDMICVGLFSTDTYLMQLSKMGNITQGRIQEIQKQGA